MMSSQSNKLQESLSHSDMRDNSEQHTLENAEHKDPDLDSIDLDNIDIDSIDLEGDSFENDSLDDADFESSELDDGDFDSSDLDDSVDADLAQSQNKMTVNNDPIKVEASHTVTKDEEGERIDKLAVTLFSDSLASTHSRAQIQDWIKQGDLTVNDTVVKPKYRVKLTDNIVLQAVLEQHGSDQPENIALDILYEDDSVVVINKPVGMVVHPGVGNWTGTLVNALLYHYPSQAHLPRAGLVHRIDKNTSGLLVIGKTKAAQLNLQEQLKDKSVYRHYRCVVAGGEANLARHRTIDAPIGRHRQQRTKMTVTSTGKDAVTHLLKITPLSGSYSLLDIGLETGRTHQIRVHLSHIGHPIVGDNVYGNRKQLRAGITEEQRAAVQGFGRQALHAYKLGFIHPETGETVEITSPMPEDMLALIEILTD